MKSIYEDNEVSTADSKILKGRGKKSMSPEKREVLDFLDDLRDLFAQDQVTEQEVVDLIESHEDAFRRILNP